MTEVLQASQSHWGLLLRYEAVSPFSFAMSIHASFCEFVLTFVTSIPQHQHWKKIYFFRSNVYVFATFERYAGVGRRRRQSEGQRTATGDFGTLCVATGRWLWMIWWQNTKLVRQHSSEILAFYLCLMTTIQPAVPICEKAALTLEEAAAFSNIGINKLREITNERNCDFVFFVGNKRLIKRKRFEQYLDRVFSL